MTAPTDGLDPAMLSAYLDGELTDEERAALDTRLDASPEWRDELAEVRAARDALRGLPLRDAPPGFWDGLRSTVGTDGDTVDDTGDTVVPIGTARARRSRWGVIAAAVAAVLAVVAVFVVPHRREVSPNVAAVVAQHGAQSSDRGDPISTLVPVGPLAGFRR